MRKLLAASSAAAIAAFSVSAAAAFAQVSQPPYGNVNGYLTPAQPPQNQMAQASAAFTASASYGTSTGTSTSSTGTTATTTATTTYQAPPDSTNASVTATENAQLNGNAPYAPRSAAAVSAPGKKTAHVATSSKKAATTTASTTSNVGAQVSSTVHDLIITRNDVNMSATATAALMKPEGVRSDADLSLFAQSVVATDPNVQQVEAADDHVALAYSVPGRFLGIVPTKVQASAAVDAAGNAKLTYPWYDFLVTVDDTAAKANLQSDVDAATGGSLTASSTATTTAPGAPNTGGSANLFSSSTLNASGTASVAAAPLSDQTKALLIAAIHDALAGWTKGQAGASATSTASSSTAY